MNKVWSIQFFRFLIIGVLNTLIGYIIFSISYYFLSNQNFAVIISYVGGILFNYNSYAKLVFYHKPDKIKIIIFITIYCTILVLNVILLQQLVSMGINVYLSQFICIFIVVPSLYLLLKKYVYVRKVNE